MIIHLLLGKCNPDNEIGVNKVVYYLTKNLKKLDCDVEIYTISKKVKKNEQIKNADGVIINIFPSALNLIMAIRKIKKDIELIHFHIPWRPVKLIILYFIIKWEIPYIVTAHNCYSPFFLKQGRFLKFLASILYELRYLNSAKAVHALCREEITDLREYGVKSDIFYLPNGIELCNLPNKLKTVYWNNLPQVKNKIKFGFIGRIAREKNLEELIKSIGLLDNSIKEKIVVIIIGTGEKSYIDNLQKLIIDSGLQENFIFAGPIYGEEKYNALSSLDVYIHPSKGEVVSMAVKEAMACCKPCVITRTSYISYFQYNDSFIMVEPYADDIKRGIITIIENSSKWSQMGQNGKSLIEKEFNWKIIAKEMLKYYSKYSRHKKNNDY